MGASSDEQGSWLDPGRQGGQPGAGHGPGARRTGQIEDWSGRPHPAETLEGGWLTVGDRRVLLGPRGASAAPSVFSHRTDRGTGRFSPLNHVTASHRQGRRLSPGPLLRPWDRGVSFVSTRPVSRWVSRRESRGSRRAAGLCRVSPLLPGASVTVRFVYSESPVKFPESHLVTLFGLREHVRADSPVVGERQGGPVVARLGVGGGRVGTDPEGGALCGGQVGAQV